MTASQLIPVVPGTIGNVQCLTVDGRTLHGVLGVRRDFSNWIKGRISKYGFIESQDFEVFAKTGENSEGGRPSHEYTCTLDMGKELCMVENNEQGRVARRYFIECERRLLSSMSPQPAEGPLSPAERAELNALRPTVQAQVSTTLPPAEEAETHLLAIGEHIRLIRSHEAALFQLSRKALPPIRKPQDMFSPARRMGLSAFQTMEDCSSTLDYSLKALEASIRTIFSLNRM